MMQKTQPESEDNFAGWAFIVIVFWFLVLISPPFILGVYAGILIMIQAARILFSMQYLDAKRFSFRSKEFWNVFWIILIRLVSVCLLAFGMYFTFKGAANETKFILVVMGLILPVLPIR